MARPLREEFFFAASLRQAFFYFNHINIDCDQIQPENVLIIFSTVVMLFLFEGREAAEEVLSDVGLDADLLRGHSPQVKYSPQVLP